MKSIVVWSFLALALAGCASEPTWNTAVFPEQPEYGMPGQATTPVDVAKK